LFSVGCAKAGYHLKLLTVTNRLQRTHPKVLTATILRSKPAFLWVHRRRRTIRRLIRTSAPCLMENRYVFCYVSLSILYCIVQFAAH